MESTALPELASVHWREPTDARWLRRHGRIWLAWTLAFTLPFVAAGVTLVVLAPISTPVALAALAHAWIIPELYAFRGASVVRPKGPRNERATSRGEPEGLTPPEAVAQGLLGDLLGHDERELQGRTGLAPERGELGTWIVGEAGALLLSPDRRRVHCFCVRTTEPELPPSDRIVHLLLALRTDEVGFATVANHAFCGAPWRVRRRLPEHMRPALDAVRR